MKGGYYLLGKVLVWFLSSEYVPNGYSFEHRVVEFASRSDMKNAIAKLDGTDLNGRKLKIYEDSRRCVLYSNLRIDA